MSKVLISELSKIRVDVDLLIQKSKKIIQSEESRLAFRSLQMTKGWLGKAKFYSGSNTYEIASEEKQIPPTQDVYEKSPGEKLFLSEDRLGKVNELREDLSLMTDRIRDLTGDFKMNNCTAKSVIKSWEFINEANMNLGFELGRMREEALAELAKPTQEKDSTNQA